MFVLWIYVRIFPTGVYSVTLHLIVKSTLEHYQLFLMDNASRYTNLYTLHLSIESAETLTTL